jgi:glucose-6-phosphate-specific signal transduction histidine kinase
LGGSLKISSDDTGTGTRVVVRLPATEVSQTEEAARAAG